MNSIARAAIVAVLLVVGLACATGRPPPPEVQFVQPPSDRVYIYVYRNEGFYNGPIGLWLDGVHAGSTRRKTFAFFQVRPGRHILTSGSRDAAELVLNALGGEVVYLQQDATNAPGAATMAISPLAATVAAASNSDSFVLTELQRVSRAEGRAGVRECRLIPDPPPPLPRVAEPEEPAEIPLTAGPRPHARP
jgi:hypothetical protein